MFAVLFACCCTRSSAQITIDLAGYPINTTGWVIGGTATPVDSTIRLTQTFGNQAGVAYYNTPLTVTNCGSLTADFDYLITNPGGCGFADGIAFFFINPLTSFVVGGGLGLPNPLTGLVFTMDTWDNDGDGQNPENQLFGYPSASTYGEGDGVHKLAPNVNHQTYMTDGNWHHVKLVYNAGTINVYLNGSTAPSMTGFFPITTTGYFGFSAATGCGFSTQYIKSVHISTAPVAPITGTPTVCVGAATALGDATASGTWISVDPTIATVSSTGAVTGVSAGVVTISYTTVNDCGTQAATVDVTVNAIPTVSVSSVANVCQSGTTAALGGSFGGSATSATWDDGGAGGTFTGNGGSTPGTATYTAPATTGPVTLTLTTAGGFCGATSASTTLSVGLATPCSISVTPSSSVYTGGVPTTLYLGYGPNSVTLTATGGSSVSWSPSTGLSSTTIANPVFTPTTPGSYTFTATVTNAGGCVSTCSVTICVIDARDHAHEGKILVCHIPDGDLTHPITISISPSGVPAHLTYHAGDHLGSCDARCGGAGKQYAGPVAEVTENAVSIFPNPNDGSFGVLIPADQQVATILVTDVTGRVLQTTSIDENNGTPVQVSIANATPGIYLVKVNAGQYSTVVKLTVK